MFTLPSKCVQLFAYLTLRTLALPQLAAFSYSMFLYALLLPSLQRLPLLPLKKVGQLLEHLYFHLFLHEVG